MNDYIIDCCSLLNLFTGWGGLEELRHSDSRWHICGAVLGEAEYTREYDKEGNPVLRALDLSEMVDGGLLLPTYLIGEQEADDFVGFATEIDDGEAQALTIAKRRNMVLLTDYRKALSVASRIDVAVSTLSTVDILRDWAQHEPKNEARLANVISRITMLAKFSPHTKSPDYAWWHSYLKN